MKKRRSRALLITAIVIAVILVGLGSLVGYVYVKYVAVERYSAKGPTVTVDAHEVKGFGTILVTDNNFALYMFPPDGRRKVTCTGDCAGNWPPLFASAGKKVVAGPGVHADLLGTMTKPGGGRVVTYNGWPLYTFVGDPDPLRARGQGVEADGGLWWVMNPAGDIVKSGPRGN